MTHSLVPSCSFPPPRLPVLSQSQMSLHSMEPNALLDPFGPHPPYRLPLSSQPNMSTPLGSWYMPAHSSTPLMTLSYSQPLPHSDAHIILDILRLFLTLSLAINYGHPQQPAIAEAPHRFLSLTHPGSTLRLSYHTAAVQVLLLRHQVGLT